MRLGVVDLFLSGLDGPLSPGSDDLHAGRQGLDRQFEADLVVALAGAAVADGVGALFQGDLGQLNADQGTGKGGTHEIILILGAGLDGGEDVILHKLTGQVQHVQLGGAGLDGLFLQPFQLVGLAHVAGDGDDLGIIVVFLQPGDDDGRIQTAGIGENDLLDVFLMDHSGFLLFCESVLFIS